ncbi:MAG TPA: hypothetical protein VFT72_10320 [Opitutaceae bacterium]|nr:hypothetical protein [Opitutaceae bacterium]
MIRFLSKASNAGWTFALAIFLGYVALPYWLEATKRGSDYGKLETVAAFAALGILFGAYGPKERIAWPKLRIHLGAFLFCTWLSFIVFAIVAFSTAEKIPLIAAFQGAGAAEVAVLREKFLKAREGWQASLVYINAIFTGALIPYALSLMFIHRARFRWVFFCLFLLYSLSFTEKAFFLKGALPFLYLALQGKIRIPVSPKVVIAGIMILLFGVTAVSRVGSEEVEDQGNFFSVAYVPHTPFQHLMWRSIIVPMVTASDALHVFEKKFKEEPLQGATSSIIAAALGKPRIPFERLVFTEQWGQNETGTGSSNSAFFTEAYVNFLWFGVLAFSFIAGRILRLMAESNDEAYKSLWMLFCFGLYNSGLIGLLLSNGFAVVLTLALLARIDPASRRNQHSSLNISSKEHGQERTHTRDGGSRLYWLSPGPPS